MSANKKLFITLIKVYMVAFVSAYLVFSSLSVSGGEGGLIHWSYLMAWSIFIMVTAKTLVSIFIETWMIHFKKHEGSGVLALLVLFASFITSTLYLIVLYWTVPVWFRFLPAIPQLVADIW